MDSEIQTKKGIIKKRKKINEFVILMKLWLRLVLQNIFGYGMILRGLKTKGYLDSVYQRSETCS